MNTPAVSVTVQAVTPEGVIVKQSFPSFAKAHAYAVRLPGWFVTIV